MTKGLHVTNKRCPVCRERLYRTKLKDRLYCKECRVYNKEEAYRAEFRFTQKLKTQIDDAIFRSNGKYTNRAQFVRSAILSKINGKGEG